MSTIDLNGIWLSYRPRGSRGQRQAPTWALQDVNLSVDAGECVALLGRNGSGKSTLLRVAGGIYSPTQGRAQIAGECGIVLELTGGLNRDLSGYQVLELYAALDGVSGPAWQRVRPKVIESTWLSDRVLQQATSTYSLGMLLRLHMALALVDRHNALVLDEVLAAADDEYRGWIVEQVVTAKRRGVAVLIASHDLGFVKNVADRVVVLTNGIVDYDGPAGQGLQRYRRHERAHREDERADYVAAEPAT